MNGCRSVPMPAMRIPAPEGRPDHNLLAVIDVFRRHRLTELGGVTLADLRAEAARRGLA